MRLAVNQELHYINPGPVETRPDQTRPDETKLDRTPSSSRDALTRLVHKGATQTGTQKDSSDACRSQRTTHKTNKPTLVAVAVTIRKEEEEAPPQADDSSVV
ncbi:unnamed protein product [Sphagnum tenellum]